MIEPLTPVELEVYFQRIGHSGPRDASVATLTALHRAHVLAIPFENLDVQFGRPLSTDGRAAFAKLVDSDQAMSKLVSFAVVAARNLAGPCKFPLTFLRLLPMAPVSRMNAA